MYTVDGIVYAGEPASPVKVVSVSPLDGGKLRLVFSTEEVKIFDFNPLLDAPVFQPLKDATVFKAVALDHGVPVWCGGEIDISPEKLYQDGIPVNPVNGPKDRKERKQRTGKTPRQQEHGLS